MPNKSILTLTTLEVVMIIQNSFELLTQLHEIETLIAKLEQMGLEENLGIDSEQILYALLRVKRQSLTK